MNSKVHYVYRITNKDTNEYYIGLRSCCSTINPLDDLGVTYFTSGKMKSLFEQSTSLFNKEIVSMFTTRNEAASFEASLIQKNLHDPLNQNRTFDYKINHPSGTEGLSVEFLNSIKDLSQSKRRRQIMLEKKRLKRVRSAQTRKSPARGSKVRIEPDGTHVYVIPYGMSGKFHPGSSKAKLIDNDNQNHSE